MSRNDKPRNSRTPIQSEASLGDKKFKPGNIRHTTNNRGKEREEHYRTPHDFVRAPVCSVLGQCCIVLLKNGLVTPTIAGFANACAERQTHTTNVSTDRIFNYQRKKR